jgi:hypothetical protein
LSTLLIGYDLNKAGKDYAELIDKIKGYVPAQGIGDNPCTFPRAATDASPLRLPTGVLDLAYPIGWSGGFAGGGGVTETWQVASRLMNAIAEMMSAAWITRAPEMMYMTGWPTIGIQATRAAARHAAAWMPRTTTAARSVARRFEQALAQPAPAHAQNASSAAIARLQKKAANAVTAAAAAIPIGDVQAYHQDPLATAAPMMMATATAIVTAIAMSQFLTGVGSHTLASLPEGRAAIRAAL